jgi:hypothetical protein
MNTGLETKQNDKYSPVLVCVLTIKDKTNPERREILNQDMVMVASGKFAESAENKLRWHAVGVVGNWISRI